MTMVLWGAFAFSLWVTVTGVSSFIFVFLFLSILFFLLISQREIRMPRSGHETALNDRVVRAGPTSEGREHGEGHSTVAKYLWLEMLSQHTVGAKGAALPTRHFQAAAEPWHPCPRDSKEPRRPRVYTCAGGSRTHRGTPNARIDTSHTHTTNDKDECPPTHHQRTQRASSDREPTGLVGARGAS